MKTPITPEALIELGFKDTSYADDMIFEDYTYSENDLIINVYGENQVDISVQGIWHDTNATTI